MKHEFKVKKLQDETVYTLESATGGGTSAGAIASVSTPVGGVQRRASLVTSEEKKDAPKPRNFVAKNAKMGGAGQHKDKKKAEKQGDVKHKKPYMESLKGRIEELKSKLDEVSLGDYRKKATMQKAQSQMGAMFAKDPEEREKNVSTFQKRERGLNRLKARDEKSRADAQTKQSADLVARLPELKAEYEKMRAEYKSLGGSNWQYADREQNLTDYERKARSMEGPMNNLWRQIQAAEKAQGEQGVAEDAHGSEHFMDIIDATNGDVRGIMQELRSSGLHSEIIKFCQWAREQGIADIFDAIKLAKRVGLENDDENEFAYEGYLRAMELLGQQGVAEGTNDTIYPNAEVIKSKNGKPVGEIYQDGNSWGAFHYKADRGYDFIDSREEAIEALKDLHQETGRSRPDYTVKGVAEGLPQTLRKVVPGHAKREIDKKMDAGKFGKTDADKDANFQRYKKIQDKIKEQGVAEEVDTGQYDARKSNAKGATTPDQEKSFREKIKQYSKELEQRQKQKEQGVAEDLDANQKRVGQLGPTEKVKNNNIGKLVGANENFINTVDQAVVTEMDSEGYKGSRDDANEIGKGKESYGKAMKAKDVAEDAEKKLNKQFDKAHDDKKEVKEGQEEFDAMMRILKK